MGVEHIGDLNSRLEQLRHPNQKREYEQATRTGGGGKAGQHQRGTICQEVGNRGCDRSHDFLIVVRPTDPSVHVRKAESMYDILLMQELRVFLR